MENNEKDFGINRDMAPECFPDTAKDPAEAPSAETEMPQGKTAQDNSNGAREKRGKKRMSPWVALLIKLAVIAAVLYGLSFFITFYSSHENGMFPSIRDGDLAIAFSTKLMKPSFNDVVVYTTTDAGGNVVKHLGRVMCLGGNEVDISDYGELLVNGSIISVNSFYEEYDRGSISYPVDVPEGSIFILQDYRPETDDSRVYGPIPEENIIGKVVFVFRVRGF